MIKKRGKETSVQEVFMRNIGVKSLSEINEWASKFTAGSYYIVGLKEAVALAKRFVNELVTIVGDYDVDGQSAVAILFKALKMAGFKNVKYRIPKRFTEGFGINPSIIDEIDSGLIITCDNGIAGIEAIAKAKQKGLTVIVIDHHEASIDENGEKILPNADIIIDPVALPGSADFDGYCGAGLCFKFATELLGTRVPELHVLATIATICDVMELREENYILVRNGLKKMAYSSYCPLGLYALLCAYNLDQYITAHEIGFKIGPALNAASRMADDGATKSVELLLYEGPYSEAVRRAEELVAINEIRKTAKNDAMKKAEEVIAAECLYGDNPLCLYIPGITEGIIGILAGNLAEKYKVSALVFTDADEEGLYKGSGRSAEGYDMKKNLDSISDLFVKYGGHVGAAGMTIRKENFEKIRESLNSANTTSIISDSDVFYDLEISAEHIPAFISELDKFAPYGQGNPMPVFKVTDYQIFPKMGKLKTLMGQDQSIVKLFGKNSTAIGFDMASKFPDNIQKVNLIGTLSTNYFQGKLSNQIEFSEFELCDSEKIETPLSKKLKEMALKK